MNKAMQAIADRFKNLFPQYAVTDTANVPLYNSSYPTLLNVDRNVDTFDGVTAIIDVQPDYRNILAYINYYINKDYTEYSFKENPCVTPPSIAGYCLYIVYAQALLNDIVTVRGRRSVYADEIYNTKFLDAVVTEIRRLYVPPFLVPILQALFKASDEKRSNLKYVYSLACFDIDHDFGRTPSPLIYFMAHHMIATLRGSSEPADIINLWTAKQVMTAPKALTIGNYLGYHAEAGAYVNWFTALNFSIFNFTTARSNTIRPTLEQMPFHPQTFTEAVQDVNPYIHLLILDPDNLATTRTVLNSLSNSLHAFYPKSVELGQIEYDTKGTQIMNHYYANLQAPTWHTSSHKKQDTTLGMQAYYKASGFKTPVTIERKTTLPALPTHEALHASLYLASGKAIEPHLRYDSEPFDPYADLQGDIRHFCPFETSTEAIYFNIVTGTTIETSTLTSSCVPQPSPDTSVQKENSFFLESAIPITHITPVALAGEANPETFCSREPRTYEAPHVRIEIVDRAIDRVPLFGPNIYPNIPAELPGFHLDPTVPHTKYACNSISYTIETGTTTTRIDNELEKVRVWSSYRHFNMHQASTVATRNKKFMLTNFRTLYGTNVTLVQTKHPILCIKRS